MKVCLACQNEIQDLKLNYNHCEWKPEVVNNFLTFAKELSSRFDNFHQKEYELLVKYEKQHPWFVMRTKLILMVINKFFLKAKSFLEIGCGTGYTLLSVQRRFPSIELTGVDMYADSLPFVKAKMGDSCSLLQLDARHMPFRDHFDLVGLFDVLEHIEQDEVVLKEVNRALKKNGAIMISVPQHPYLWCSLDEIAFHMRRYTASELENKLKAAGFSIKYKTSFLSFLFPLLFVAKFVGRSDKAKETLLERYLNLPFIFNFLLKSTFKLEYWIIKLGFRFPFGNTLFMVATKD
jgi:ubiquinone/menaquinone biosynthesis C-methylase UbiE